MMSRPITSTPTDWELKLLKILWDGKCCSVDDVREVLRNQGLKRSDSAVRKMLHILVEKGLASSEADGRTALYKPLVRQSKIEKGMLRHLIDSLFGGNEEVFLLRAMSETTVSPEIVEKMREMVREHEDKE